MSEDAGTNKHIAERRPDRIRPFCPEYTETQGLNNPGNIGNANAYGTREFAGFQLTNRIIIYNDTGESPTLEPHNEGIRYKLEDKLSLNDYKLTAISGALAGFISGIMVCPLDVTKTRLQAQGLQGGENPYYRGIWGTMSTIAKDEGFLGLYKGIVPILLGYFPTWTIYFSVYESSKKVYPQIFPYSDFISHSCSAITAGAVSTTVTNPIWVVKTRLMLQTDMGKNSTHYRGTLDAFRTMWKQEGIRSFYTGLVPSLLGLFHVAIHFPVYEKLKLRFKCYSISRDSHHGDGSVEYALKLPNLIMASSVSKMVASSLTYPHEILRTRMQLKSTNKRLQANIQHKLIPLMKATYINEGLRGFYSGFTANLIRTVPASAITLVSFEYVRNHLARLH